jgi:hypothetical protein
VHAFTQRLARRIQQPQPDTIAASLGDAVEMMRMWSSFGGDPGAPAVVGPFSEEVEYPWVCADDVEALKAALVTFVRRHRHHPQLAGAVHAFGYLAASDTKGLLIEVLRDCLGRDSGALYQTILALVDLGEEIYGPCSSSSILDVERNERAARDYLALLTPDSKDKPPSS